MPLISISLDHARQSVSILKSSSNLLSELQVQSDNQWKKLDANWQGHSKSFVESEIHNLYSRSSHLIQNAQGIGIKLEAIANRFESADASTGEPVLAGGWSWVGSSSPVAMLSPFLLSIPGILPLSVLLSDLITKYRQPPILISPIPETAINKTLPKAIPPQPLTPAPSSNATPATSQVIAKSAPPKPPAQKPRFIKDFPSRPGDDTFLVGQEKSDSCTFASTRMALQKAVGLDVAESDLREMSSKIKDGYENNSNKWGTSPDTVATLINDNYSANARAEYHYPDSQTLDQIESAVKENKGIIVSVRNSEWLGYSAAHSVTVVDIQSDENGNQYVYVNDPWPSGQGKKMALPAEDFKRAWFGDATYIQKVKEE